jgi:hypothetical protein
MNVRVLAGILAMAGCALPARSAPMTFEEISLRVRTGDSTQGILQDVGKRKLVRALTPQQEASLSSAGAPVSFLKALRRPELVTTAEEVAAFESRQRDLKAAEAASREAPRVLKPVPPIPAVPAKDFFGDSLEAAKSPDWLVIGKNDAFDLDHLDQAMAKARTERKPMGFILVWNQYFGVRTNTRGRSGPSAMAHFCQAFKVPLVLVFVHHETDLPRIPEGVARGFNGPEEGGLAPNMAVVDATGRELIVEVPMGGPQSSGEVRDAIFTRSAERINQWLAAHPDALAAGVK